MERGYARATRSGPSAATHRDASRSDALDKLRDGHFCFWRRACPPWLPSRCWIGLRSPNSPRSGAGASCFATCSCRLQVPAQKYLFLFVRRSAAAIRAYEVARAATAELVRNLSRTTPPLSRYAEAMDCWDAFIGQAYQALQCLAKLAQLGPREMFAPGTGELFDRCSFLYNAAKHSYDRVTDGMPQAEAMLPPFRWKRAACTAALAGSHGQRQPSWWTGWQLTSGSWTRC